MSTSPAGEATLPPAALRIAEAIGAVAAAEPRLVGVYLFGSHASGEAHATSDVDLGALFATRLGIWELLGLEARFEDALGTEVDLVDAATASPYLALDIVRGERLYCADADACDDFELYVLRRAADLAPFERQRRHMLLGHGAERAEGS